MDKVACVEKKNSDSWNLWYCTLGDPSHHDVVLPSAGCTLKLNPELLQNIPLPSQTLCHLSIKMVFYSSEAIQYVSRPTSIYISKNLKNFISWQQHCGTWTDWAWWKLGCKAMQCSFSDWKGSLHHILYQSEDCTEMDGKGFLQFTSVCVCEKKGNIIKVYPSTFVPPSLPLWIKHAMLDHKECTKQLPQQFTTEVPYWISRQSQLTSTPWVNLIAIS